MLDDMDDFTKLMAIMLLGLFAVVGIGIMAASAVDIAQARAKTCQCDCKVASDE